MNPAPPKFAQPVSANGWFAGIILGAVAVGVGAMIFFFNPATHAFYPVCRFHQLTGLNCPGCGSTRSFYALVHGNFAAALRDNALFIFVLAAAAIRRIWLIIRKVRGQPVGEIIPVRWLWPLLAIAVIFTVLRNLPAFSFLSPA